MRSHILALCMTAAWVAGVSQSAIAQMVAQSSLPESWSRDVPGGQFENLLQLVTCKANVFSAAVTVDHLNQDASGRFGPTVRIMLATQDATKPAAGPIETAVLEISATSASQVPRASFSRFGAGAQLLDRTDLGEVALGKKTAFDLQWNDSGVTASIDGGEKHQAKLGTRPLSMLLIISGAAARFSEMRSGFEGAPSTGCTPSATP